MMARRQATRGKRRPHRLVVAASASLLTFVGLASVTPVTGVWADDPITLLVHNRPPLYVIDGDTVTGSVAAPAFQAFLSAGISAEWQVMPSNRQLKIVKDNASRVCAVGWFRTVEREKFALFTKSIFKGQPEVAIIRSDDARVWGHPTLTSLFLDERLIMGRKLGYLYGAKIERFADEHSTPSVTTSQNAEGMARMLLSGRFDYFFSDPEEADVLLSADEFERASIAKKSLKDMTPGNARHIMCSQQVGRNVISRLNAEISAMQIATVNP